MSSCIRSNNLSLSVSAAQHAYWKTDLLNFIWIQNTKLLCKYNLAETENCGENYDNYFHLSIRSQEPPWCGCRHSITKSFYIQNICLWATYIILIEYYRKIQCILKQITIFKERSEVLLFHLFHLSLSELLHIFVQYYHFTLNSAYWTTAWSMGSLLFWPYSNISSLHRDVMTGACSPSGAAHLPPVVCCLTNRAVNEPSRSFTVPGAGSMLTKLPLGHVYYCLNINARIA